MVETYHTLADGKRVLVQEITGHPDVSGVVVVNIGLKADVPTYQVTAENVSLSSGKNLLSIFNNMPSTRVRVQSIVAYPTVSGNNNVTLKLMYINNTLSGGVPAFVDKFAVDFLGPSPNFQAQVGNTSPTPVSGVNLGGNRIGLGQTGKFEIFGETRNSSALELRPQQDGITVKQMDGNSNGNLTIHAIVTPD